MRYCPRCQGSYPTEYHNQHLALHIEQDEREATLCGAALRKLPHLHDQVVITGDGFFMVMEDMVLSPISWTIDLSRN